jgi:hypothetical protein
VDAIIEEVIDAFDEATPVCRWKLGVDPCTF